MYISALSRLLSLSLSCLFSLSVSLSLSFSLSISLSLSFVSLFFLLLPSRAYIFHTKTFAAPAPFAGAAGSGRCKPSAPLPGPQFTVSPTAQPQLNQTSLLLSGALDRVSTVYWCYIHRTTQGLPNAPVQYTTAAPLSPSQVKRGVDGNEGNLPAGTFGVLNTSALSPFAFSLNLSVASLPLGTLQFYLTAEASDMSMQASVFMLQAVVGDDRSYVLLGEIDTHTTGTDLTALYVVVAVVGCLAVVAAAFYLYRRHRLRQSGGSDDLAARLINPGFGYTQM